MKATRLALNLACLAAGLLPLAAPAATPVRALLITGGHAYDTNEFHATFRSLPGVTIVQQAVQPQAQQWFAKEKAADYDVIVLYDMWQNITEESKANLVARLKEGKGLVITHHAVANYQKWPEWEKILGGRYYLEKTTVNGVEKPPSIWKHDVDVPVKIVDAKHPITRGLKDFTIHDETYGLYDMAPDSHLLLSADEPTSAKHIAWARTYEQARVVYLQLGHDKQAYANPNYQALVRQAIQWTAKRAN